MTFAEINRKLKQFNSSNRLIYMLINVEKKMSISLTNCCCFPIKNYIFTLNSQPSIVTKNVPHVCRPFDRGCTRQYPQCRALYSFSAPVLWVHEDPVTSPTRRIRDSAFISKGLLLKSVHWTETPQVNIIGETSLNQSHVRLYRSIVVRNVLNSEISLE